MGGANHPNAGMGGSCADNSAPHHARLLQCVAEFRKFTLFDGPHLPIASTDDEIRELTGRLLEEDRRPLDLLMKAARYSSWLREYSSEFAALASLVAPFSRQRSLKIAAMIDEVNVAVGSPSVAGG